MIEKLFAQEVENKGIIKNLSVLSPHFIPPELPHRMNEAKEVTKTIAPILRNEKPGNIFLYGKTGTGKTSVVKYVTQKLLEVTADPSKNPHNALVSVVYMNCRLGYNSKYQVLLKILEDESLNSENIKDAPLSKRRSRSLAGMSPTQLYENLKNVVEKNALGLIVILDEIDMIRMKDINDLVYMLTRINDEIKYVEVDGEKRKGCVVITGISNKFSFNESLDPRTKSTLCEEEMVFRPYNAGQLKTILAKRIKLGFRSGTIADSNIALIAAYAAQTNGDARYALKLLQKAAEVAQDERRKRIRKDDVVEARARVEEDITFELITTLPEHQQVVLYAISELLIHGSNYRRLTNDNSDLLFSGEVYESYEKVCKHIRRKPRTMRWFREYLNDLEMLGLITLSISGKGVRGNTTIIRLGNPCEEVQKIVAQSLGLT